MPHKQNIKEISNSLSVQGKVKMMLFSVYNSNYAVTVTVTSSLAVLLFSIVGEVWTETRGL